VPRAAAIVALALVLAETGCGGSSSSGGSTEATGGCDDVSAPAPRAEGGATRPTERLDPTRIWTLTFDTSCGTFVVTLDLASAPATAASLVSLANAGFYDDTVFHRIVPGFVVQGGDPTQTGTGGPGYETADVPKPDAAYTKGVVAMAKTAAEPAGTAGSQFFVVIGDDVGLPPDYAVVGKVTEGMDVVERIGQLGDPTTEQPLQPVVIHSVEASSAS
jgi:peptidyl-prolyl cis-trans isomerase B (cyclophilin B)